MSLIKRYLNWFIIFIISMLPLSLILFALQKAPGHIISNNVGILLVLIILLIIFFTYKYAVAIKIISPIKKEYFKIKEISLGFLLLMFTSMITGIISQKLGTNQTSNQASLNELSKEIPFFLFALVSIVAGFFEELVYRVGVFKLLAPKYPKLAFLISVLIFGFAHNPTDLGSFLIYMSLATVLTYIYYHFENFYLNMTVHALWNIFVTLLSLTLIK
jgi:CAAX amino terminal protease family.